MVVVPRRDETDVFSAPPPLHQQAGMHARSLHGTLYNLLGTPFTLYLLVYVGVPDVEGKCFYRCISNKILPLPQKQAVSVGLLPRLLSNNIKSSLSISSSFLDCHPDALLRPESKKSLHSQSCILNGAFVPNTCRVWTPLPSSVPLVLASVATTMGFHTQWSIIPFRNLKNCTMFGVFMWSNLLVSAHCTYSVPACLCVSTLKGGGRNGPNSTI
jgi:hypothetical protein